VSPDHQRRRREEGGGKKMTVTFSLTFKVRQSWPPVKRALRQYRQLPPNHAGEEKGKETCFIFRNITMFFLRSGWPGKGGRGKKGDRATLESNRSQVVVERQLFPA